VVKIENEENTFELRLKTQILDQIITHSHPWSQCQRGLIQIDHPDVANLSKNNIKSRVYSTNSQESSDEEENDTFWLQQKKKNRI
jgi:hypothetical protein